MILADKIIKLRKQFGWSQEDLAEKMGVSRQSVSKWESANSIPDINKIINMAEIFGVTTDYLLKDDIETIQSIDGEIEPEVNSVNLNQANRYVEIKDQISRITVKGVLLCVCSVVPLLFMLSMAQTEQMNLDSKTATVSGIITMLVMVALAVSFFVRTGQFSNEIYSIEKDDFELEYGVRSIFKEKLQQITPSYHKKLSISIGLFILSIVPFMYVAINEGTSDLILKMLCVMFFMIATGLYIIVPASAEYNAYSLLIKEGDYHPRNKEENKKIEALAGFYWPLLIAIYLGWSFWTMRWDVTWIVWPVGAVLFAALVGLMEMITKDRE
ncbi:helix-turn-helix domain-containing protein [Aliikangiella coralliicola]|uniref:Helix-turn-helix transcriptional regulator n=1 Tax=Aliikangiella coralliicola TaxID=2592383 RepID=A0A545UCG1_9GAMM|nr:helix-turn-helix transcriptional regulator [Aliikangiella coralliicola]TQV87161.1 helix-turn-helix transcriptional regulator [Aliikangiella coralliicola]